MKIPLMRLQENTFGSKKSDASPLPHPLLPPSLPSTSQFGLCVMREICMRAGTCKQVVICARACVCLYHPHPTYFSDQKVASLIMKNVLPMDGLTDGWRDPFIKMPATKIQKGKN